MNNQETRLIDCGHGAVRIKAYLTTGGLGYLITAFKPAWTEDGTTEPPQSCMFTINGGQAMQIAGAIAPQFEGQAPYEKALRELVKQITVGTFIDTEGHDAKMLFAYKKAEELLASTSTSGADHGK